MQILYVIYYLAKGGGGVFGLTPGVLTHNGSFAEVEGPERGWWGEEGRDGHNTFFNNTSTFASQLRKTMENFIRQ